VNPSGVTRERVGASSMILFLLELASIKELFFRFYQYDKPDSRYVGTGAIILLDELDKLSDLYAFLGQVRDRLLYLMTDPHERIVPPIMKWILTGCDVNKDVTVSDMLQLTAIDIQLKDADRVFRLYIKSLGDKAVYRVEESLKMRCPIVDVLSTIRSPS